MTRDCATRVLFLGDSYTDGVGVSASETFVNRYGHLVRDRLRIAVCPSDAGVEGYGSLEECYGFETYFEALGRPPVIVVMHYANDIEDDEDAVLQGRVRERDRTWQESQSFLERMAAFARSKGATMLIAAIPPAQQLAAPETRQNYQGVLRRFSERNGIGFVDLLDPLVQSGARTAYFEDDPHWTPAGHRVAAETLLEATRGLLDK